MPDTGSCTSCLLEIRILLMGHLSPPIYDDQTRRRAPVCIRSEVSCLTALLQHEMVSNCKDEFVCNFFFLFMDITAKTCWPGEVVIFKWGKWHFWSKHALYQTAPYANSPHKHPDGCHVYAKHLLACEYLCNCILAADLFVCVACFLTPSSGCIVDACSHPSWLRVTSY